jgi:hypothetical protein
MVLELSDQAREESKDRLFDLSALASFQILFLISLEQSLP